MQSKHLLFAILSFFSLNTSLYPAIAESTIVSSTKGHTLVEKLAVDDEVLGYDGKNQELTVTKVKKITSEKTDAIYAIEVNNETLRVSGDHLFFDPANDTWVPAKELTTEHILVPLTAENNQFIFSPMNILKVEKITKPTTIFEVELESPHTFFITKSRILTHNFDIGGSVEFAFGAGEIVWTGLTVGVALVGCWLSETFFEDKAPSRKIHNSLPQFPHNNSPSPHNKKPDDKNKNKRDLSRGVNEKYVKQRGSKEKPKGMKGVLKKENLPTRGKVRFVPSEKARRSLGNDDFRVKLSNGTIGFKDKHGNVWVRGDSRTAGEPKEFDMQLLGEKGKSDFGWASKDGNHVNVSYEGKITH